MISDFARDNLSYLISFSILWIASWVTASILYRRSHSKPILFWTVDNADFIERSASGHSHHSWYAKLGGASRCLVVAVANGRLIVRPVFPFNLMFLPEIYGLEHDVPLDYVTHAELKVGMTQKSVELEFQDTHSKSHKVTLYLKEPERLLTLLPAVALGANG